MTEVICLGGFVIAAAAIVGIDLARIARAIERLRERLDDAGVRDLSERRPRCAR